MSINSNLIPVNENNKTSVRNFFVYCGFIAETEVQKGLDEYLKQFETEKPVEKEENEEEKKEEAKEEKE